MWGRRLVHIVHVHLVYLNGARAAAAAPDKEEHYGLSYE
jgi:hypothetical protein